MALTLAVGVLAGAGCTTPQPAPTESTPQGVPFDLYTHCGIDELVHDGRWYRHVDSGLDDDGGSPPHGWGDPFQEGWLLVEGDRATFTDDEGNEEVFEVREGATGPLNVCA